MEMTFADEGVHNASGRRLALVAKLAPDLVIGRGDAIRLDPRPNEIEHLQL
jgi:hypothetical protein